jgi:hypothetical protein
MSSPSYPNDWSALLAQLHITLSTRDVPAPVWGWSYLHTPEQWHGPYPSLDEAAHAALLVVAALVQRATQPLAASPPRSRTLSAGEERVLRWITQRHLARFTKREAYHALRGTYKTVVELEPHLAALVQRGFLRHDVTPERPLRGRRPSDVYVVVRA